MIRRRDIIKGLLVLPFSGWIAKAANLFDLRKLNPPGGDCRGCAGHYRGWHIFWTGWKVSEDALFLPSGPLFLSSGIIGQIEDALFTLRLPAGQVITRWGKSLMLNRARINTFYARTR